MMEAMFILLLAALAALAVVWWTGRREPVYAICGGATSWFVALRYADPSREPPLDLAAGVRQRWSVHADFTLIGEGEKYWDRFLILSAGAQDQRLPLVLNAHHSDAYVVELNHLMPPVMALGLFRLLHLTGIWSMPAGAVATDPQTVGARLDALPTKASIAELLSRPPDYAPAMVNFLKYFPTARYQQSLEGAPAVSGSTAYSRYGIVALQSVYKTGGRLAFFSNVKRVVLEARGGPTRDRWDDIAVMEYTEPKGLLSLEQIPRYYDALKHRDAGLERTIIIASSHDEAPRA